MKTLIIGLLMAVSFNASSMRCGTHLITEGDTAAKMVALCGEPSGFGQTLYYINKDGDGMDYYIHTNAAGVIDSINFNRD